MCGKFCRKTNTGAKSYRTSGHHVSKFCTAKSKCIFKSEVKRFWVQDCSCAFTVRFITKFCYKFKALKYNNPQKYNIHGTQASESSGSSVAIPRHTQACTHVKFAGVRVKIMKPKVKDQLCVVLVLGAPSP